MHTIEQSLKAKYQVNRNLFVTCYLDVIEATSEGMKTQVGIRSPGDTVIPVGTKLYLSSLKAKQLPSGHQAFELYYVVVQGIEIEYGMPVQLCSPIAKEIRTNKRATERKEALFNVGFEEIGETGFTAINGTPGGLTLMYQPSKILVGMVLGSKYRLVTTYKEQNFSMPVQIAHIHYDWRSNQHLLGVQILKLSQADESALNHLIDPDYKIEYKQANLVDTDEARIRPELL